MPEDPIINPNKIDPNQPTIGDNSSLVNSLNNFLQAGIDAPKFETLTEDSNQETRLRGSSKDKDWFEYYDKYKSRVGKEIYNKQDPYELLAKDQSFLEAGWRRMKNLIPNIGLGIVETIGQIGEIPDFIMGDADFSNSLTEWAKANKNPLGETYRSDRSDNFDYSDPIWWLDNGAGLVESIGQFAATGMGVGSIVGKGANAFANALKIGQNATKLGTLTNTAITKALPNVITSATLAYTEGAMSGADIFKQTYEDVFNRTGNEEYAKQEAANAAATTVKINTAINTALNLYSVGTLFKTSKSIINPVTKSLKRLAGETDDAFLNRLKSLSEQLKPSVLKSLKRYGLEAPLEATEEVVNVFAEKEGRIAGGLEKSKGYIQDFIDAALSEEGLVSAALGAIGGVGQISVLNNIPQIQKADNKLGFSLGDSKRKEEFDYQNRYYTAAIQNLKEDLINFQEYSKELQEGAEEGNNIKIENAKNKLFNVSTARSIVSGTGENLISTFQQIASVDNNTISEDGKTEAMRQGLAESPNDNSYKQEANEKIQELKKYSEDFSNLQNKFQQEDLKNPGFLSNLFKLHLDIESDNKLLKELNNEYQKVQLAAANIETLSNLYKDSPKLQQTERLANLMKQKEESVSKFVNIIDEAEEVKKRLEKNNEDFNDLINNPSKYESKLDKEVSKTKSKREKNKKKAEEKVVNTELTSNIQSEKIDKLNKITTKEISQEDIKAQEKALNDLESSIPIEEKEILKQQLEEQKEINRLTPDEESFKSAIEEEAKGELNPEFTTKDKEDTSLRELDNADTTLVEHDPNSEKEITPENTFNYLYYRVKKAFNKFAYLSRNYINVITDTAKSREDISNTLNEKTFLPILNPNKYQAGTKVTLKLDDRFEIPITDPLTKEETTWRAYKAVNNITEGSEKYIKHVPIAVVNEQGNTISFLHDTNWINEDNVQDTKEGLKKQVEDLIKIREYIVTNKEVTTTITSKSFGVFFKPKDNKVKPVSEMMQDPNLIIAYDRGAGLLETSRGTQFKGKVVNSTNKGRTYTIVQVGLENNEPVYMALPVLQSKVNKEIVSTLVEATRAYLTGDQNIIDNIYKVTNEKLNIKNFKDLKQLYETFIYNYKPSVPFKQFITEGSVANSEKFLIHLSGNSIDFGRPGVSKSHRFLNKEGFAKLELPAQAENLRKLEEYLTNQYFNTNSELLESDIIIPQIVNGEVEVMFNGKYNDFVKQNTSTNIMGVEVEEGVYSYTIQPVIKFDDSFVNPKVEEKPQLETTESEGPTASKELFDIDIEIDPEAFEGLEEYNEDLLPQPKTPEQLSTTIDLYNEFTIKGLNPKLQSELISTIAYSAYRQAAKGEEVKYKDLFQKWFDTFQTAKNKSTNSLTTKVLTNILNDWSKVKGLTATYISKLNGTSITEDSVIDEDFIAEFESNTFDENRTLKLDSKDTISANLRKFFAFTESRTKDFTIKKNFLGQPAFENFDTVYDTLHQILVNTAPNLNDMQQELINQLDKGSKLYWLQSVIENLDDADSTIKNQFVVDMTKHYVKMKKIMWAKKPIYSKDKKLIRIDYDLILVDDNANSIQQAILGNWYNNLKTSDLVKVVGGEYYLNEEATKQAIEEASKIETKEQLNDWFNKIGISLDPITLDIIFEGKFYYKRKYWSLEQQKSDKGGIIKSIVDSFNNSLSLNTSIEDNKSYTKESVIQALANLEGQHSSAILSNSHRSGGEIIYSYSVNKWFIDRFNALTKNIDNLQEKLSKVAFAKDSMWLSWFKSGNESLSNMDYFYTSLEPLKQMDKPSRKNRDLTKLSDEEHELYKIGHFTYNAETVKTAGKEYRKVNFLYPTMSDKTNTVGLNTYAIIPDVDKEGNIQDSTVELLFKQLVQPEINRMAAHGKQNINQKDYNKGVYHFYFLPKLNENQELIDNIKAGNYSLDSFREFINTTIKDYVKALVDQKLELWDSAGIGSSNKETKEEYKFLNKKYIDEIAKGDSQEAKLKFAATDMVVNYMIANANIHATFLTDPANYVKFEEDENGKIVLSQKETETNIGKRLAFDGAPGQTLADSDTNDYYQVFLKDPKRASEEVEYYKELFKDFRSEAYEYEKGSKTKKGIEGADAQEFITTKERLYVMFKRGAFTQELYDKATSIISKEIKKGNFDYWANLEEELTGDEKKILFNPKIWQPEKPAYTNQLIDETTGHERRLYIKSSAFPLIPILTKNMELDKVRIALEKFEENSGKTVRAVFGTGTKLGYINNPIEIYNEDSTVKDFEVTEDNVLLLPRIGFRIQQDVPFDETKNENNRGSQEAKLLFTDIRDIKGIAELEKKYLDNYKQLYQLKLKELEDELLVDGKVDIQKLGKLLIEEAKKRNYSLNDILGLNITDGEFDIPLWLSSSSYKYQSMLNSIVNNRIIKLKFPGRSFVLGTEEGFNNKPKIIGIGQGTKKLRKYKGIVFTNKWTGKLLPANMKVGQPDQVLVSWKHKERLEKLINNKGQLDVTKLDEDVLKLFGFRIPTQGLNSMAMIEIVGFLPPEAGDLIIAPRDFTKRMGSDFDIDKLYTYMYPTTVDEDGRIIVDRSTEENRILSEILDIHFDIMSNPDPKIQKKISAALDFGLLKGESGRDASDKIEAARRKSFEYNTILSDEYQKQKFLSATAGKVLVGITSNLSVLNSVAQGKNLQLEDVTFKLGNMESNGSLFGKRTFRNRFISLVAAAFQSAAVDNEKEQILSKINLNVNTSDVMIAMTAMGYDEDIIAAFLSQPIIEDYVKALRKYTSSLQGYTANADQKAFDEVVEKYGKPNLKESKELSDLGDSTPDQVFGKLLSLIYSKEEPEFNKLQVGFLQKFRDLSEYGKMIGGLQTTINTDSSGVPKNLFESSTKESLIKNLPQNPIINSESLIGEYLEDEVIPTTINGFASVYGLFTANKLWKQYFQPYFSKSLDILFNEYLTVTKSNEDSVSKIASAKRDLFEEIKSYIFTQQDSGIYDENIISERSRLFLDTETNQSLGTILDTIKDLPYYQTNNFLNKITVAPNKNGLPSTVRFNASTGENFDESNIYLGALEMLASKNQPILGTFNGIEYTPKLLAQDLISYSYLSGGQQGAIDFTRYIPATYLIDSGFIKSMKSINWSDTNTFGINSLEKDEQFLPSNFITQYAQSNGIELPSATTEDIISEEKTVDKINTFRLNQSGINKFVIDNNFPSFISIYNPAIPKGGNRYSVFQHIIVRDNSGALIDIYQKIDTLGTFGMSEYNFNGEGKTIIDAQKANQQPLITETKPQGIQVLTNTEKITSTEKSGLSSVSSKEQIIKKLENIALKSDNQYYSLLAQELLKAKVNIPNDIKLKVVKEFKSKGSYNYDNNIITINTYNDEATVTELQKYFLHELIHGYTGNAANIFEKLGAAEAKKQKKLTEAQIIQLVKLKNLQKQYIDAVIKSGRQEELNQFLREWEANKGNANIDEADITAYYGATKLSEFISMAMTEPEFQDLLNSVTDKNKTFFDKFKEIIISLLNALGLEVNKDSILESTINSVLELVNTEQPEITIEETEDLLIDNIPQSYKDLWKSQKAEFITKHNLNLDKPISVATFERLKQSAKKDKYNTLKLELDQMGTKYLRINMVKPSQTEINFEDLGESYGQLLREVDAETRAAIKQLVDIEFEIKCKK